MQELQESQCIPNDVLFDKEYNACDCVSASLKANNIPFAFDNVALIDQLKLPVAEVLIEFKCS